MEKTELVELMDEVSFFNDFLKEEKLSLSDLKDSILKFEQKANLIKGGSIENSVYILLQGKAIVSRQQTPHMTIATLDPGAVCGEISFLGNRPRITNVIADSNVVALKLNSELLLLLPPLLGDKLNNKFKQILINRIENMNKSITKLKVEIEAISQMKGQLEEEIDTATLSMGRVKTGVNDIASFIQELIR